MTDITHPILVPEAAAEPATNKAPPFGDSGRRAISWLPGSLDPHGFLQGRRQDVEAMAAIARIAGDSARTIVDKQAATIRGMAADLRQLMVGQPAGEGPRDDIARSAAHSALSAIGELAEVALNAQSEVLDIVRQRVQAKLEASRKLLAPTT